MKLFQSYRHKYLSLVCLITFYISILIKLQLPINKYELYIFNMFSQDLHFS